MNPEDVQEEAFQKIMSSYNKKEPEPIPVAKIPEVLTNAGFVLSDYIEKGKEAKEKDITGQVDLIIRDDWFGNWDQNNGKVAVWTLDGKCYVAKASKEVIELATQAAKTMNGKRGCNVPES